jgi:gliding motility-associated transport system ATP-binding protein
LISVEHFTKYYGAFRAVSDVSFSVPAGEVAALLGPNGSGKSTVMRAITGYFSPTAGRILVGGVDVSADPHAAKRQIGYLPEQVSLYPELTVRRFLSFVAEVRGLAGGPKRAAVGSVIDQCGLAEVADRLAGKLSKGYRQRVGLAQALVGDPKVLVLDEPTVGLDPVQTMEMRSLVRGLRGRTVLLSTHILSEASALCSRIVILARGRVVAEDSADGLARRLSGVSRLGVRIEGPPEAVASLLASLPGVLRVEPGVPDGGVGVAFELLAHDPAPVQRALAASVVNAGWTLLEVRTAVPSLEDLFVQAIAPGVGVEAPRG